MTNFKFIRTVFQLVAFGIFCIQMYLSLEKFIAQPMTQQISTVSLDKIENPVIYLCQDAQFNYTYAASMSYYSLWQLLIGQIENSNNFTWTGKFRNSTFKELQSKIFDVDNEFFEIFSSETKNDDWQNTTTDEIFIMPFGQCLKPANPTDFYYAISTKPAVLIIVDPALDNDFRISGIKFGTFSFGHLHNSFEGYIYEVDITMLDNRVNDGRTCIDYGRIESSYGECIKDKLKGKFLQWLGCYPPWLQDSSNLTCLPNHQKQFSAKHEYYEMQQEIIKLVTGLELNSFKNCLPPCTTMELNYNLRRHLRNGPHFTAVKVKIMENVKVHTEVLAFGLWHLIVDLGSALGLWLGLSALSIFDNMLELYVSSRKKCCH